MRAVSLSIGITDGCKLDAPEISKDNELKFHNPRFFMSSRKGLTASYVGFFTAGFTIAAWAPLIPFVKEALQASPSSLGILLLMLGFGSILGMPLAGWLAVTLGPRRSIALSGLGSCLALILLAAVPGYLIECASLFFYGVTLGCLEVSMNLYGAALERHHGRRLMSGCHAFYSIGEVAAAVAVSGALWFGLTPFAATTIMMALLGVVFIWSLPGVLELPLCREEEGAFEMPKGVVWGLALLCAVIFLAEGAMLDWSALFLKEEAGVRLEEAGIGYTLFVIAMALARLVGDKLVTKLGAVRMAWGGVLLMIASLAAMVAFPVPAVVLTALFMMGLGIANVAPLIVSAASRQRTMPALPAVTAVTTIGYAGLTAGPALLGFVSEYSSLLHAFAVLAGLLVVVGLGTRRVSAAL